MLDRKSHVPLYIQLADHIKNQINEGNILPGDKLPSEAEMIKQFDLGRLTVREALGILVQEDIIEKRHGKGSFCKQKPISSTTKLNIDVLLDMSDTYFIPYYMQSISKIIQDNNANFIVSDTRNSPLEIQMLLENIIQRGTSGIILQPSAELVAPSAALIETFKKLRIASIPYIMIDSKYDHINSSFTVFNENKVGELAADYFIQNGHQHLAAIYVPNCKDSLCRLDSFTSCLAQHNLPKPTILKYDILLKESLESLIHQKELITGIFCYNDEVAYDCNLYLKEMGVSVPKDISLIGCDDTILAQTMQPTLTTIAHPKGILGETASLALLGLISGEYQWPFHKTFEPDLVIRDSVAPPPKENNSVH